MCFYWLAGICSLPTALLHAVPMVPRALIGYCKVWDEETGLAQHPCRYWLDPPVSQPNSGAAPRLLPRSGVANWLLYLSATSDWSARPAVSDSFTIL